jgi:hypothetical protein
VTSSPKIFVDADALPRAARDIIVRASGRCEIDVLLVANGWYEKPRARRVEVELVAPGEDVADDRIVELIGEGDLCITSDIPLAARVVEEGADCITPRGRELTEDTVGPALSLRDFHTDLRDSGIQTGGLSAYDSKAKEAFANALDRWLTKNV